MATTKKTATEELAEMEAEAKAALKAEAEAKAKAEAEAKQREDAAKAAMTEAEKAKVAAKRQSANGVYYIVNPAGAIHGVTRAHAADRLKTAGWRLATEEEIAAYLGQSIQRHDRPICAPWTADPDKQLAALEG